MTHDEKENGDEWLAIGEHWRSQPTSTLNIAGLRIEAARRTRKMWLLLAAEMLSLVVVAMSVAELFLQDREFGFKQWLVLPLIGIVLCFYGWTIWSRRRLWRDSGLDAAATIELEIARAHNALRYWRLSSVASCAVWGALVAMLMARQVFLETSATPGGWLAVAINLPLVLLAIAFERWRAPKLQARIRTLRALQDELLQ